MLLFLLGSLLGLLTGLWQVRRFRREAEHNAEERQNALREKLVVVGFVHGMAEALGENRSRIELLERIVHAAILSTNALSACLFERTTQGTMRGVAAEGLFPPQCPLPDHVRGGNITRARLLEQIMRLEEFPATVGVVGEVVRHGQAVLIADADSDDRIVKHDDSALKMRSFIAAPVRFRDEFYGVLCIANPSDGLPFSGDDFSLVRALAEQAGMAVHNQSLLRLQIEKRQLDLDLALASSIQQLLLPREAPSVPGLEVDARYRSAQQVSGDFYDLIPLADGRLGVAVADVSGKGIAASLLMAICRTNLRQLAARDDSPASVLAGVNRAMSGEMRQGMYITMIYAIIDPSRGEICYARAGHERPLFFCREAEAPHGARFLDSEGMAVGLVPDGVFLPALAEVRVRFAAGDVFVLYTDGLTEAPDPMGVEFSGERLAAALRELGDRSPAALNDGILERVRHFTGKNQGHDDLTLVTIRRAG